MSDNWNDEATKTYAWRWYVAHHIDTVMAWAEAKERVEPYGLQVSR